MSGIPFVIAENGIGIPVNPVADNAPLLKSSSNGFGIPIVIDEKGAPFVLDFSGPGLDPDVSALIGRFSIQPDDDYLGHMNGLVITLKNAGLWHKMDAFYILGGEDQQSSMLNWISDRWNLYKSGPGDIVFVPFVGMSSDLTENSGLGTGFVAADHPDSKYTYDDAALTVWTTRNIRDPLPSYVISWLDLVTGGAAMITSVSESVGTTTYCVNARAHFGVHLEEGQYHGMFTASRLAGDNKNYLWVNGDYKLAGDLSPSDTIKEIFLFSGPSYYSSISKQNIYFACISGGLNQEDAKNLNDLVRVFKESTGVSVVLQFDNPGSIISMIGFDNPPSWFVEGTGFSLELAGIGVLSFDWDTDHWVLTSGTWPNNEGYANLTQGANSTQAEYIIAGQP